MIEAPHVHRIGKDIPVRLARVSEAGELKLENTQIRM
jgi:hypothetical protein